MPKTKKPWHQGTYHVQSARLRQAAHASPHTRCWRCNLTLADARAQWGPKTHWQAGHLQDESITAPMLPECSHCNASHGATAGNLKRQGITPQAQGPKRTELTW